MAAEPIGRERAAELVEECEGGVLVVFETSHVPTLGDVDPTDLQYRVDAEMYVIETDSDSDTDSNP